MDQQSELHDELERYRQALRYIYHNTYSRREIERYIHQHFPDLTEPDAEK